jgi:hypothetical protein
MRVAYGGIREQRARIAHIYDKFDKDKLVKLVVDVCNKELYAPITH